MMAIGDVTNVSSEALNQFIVELGRIGLWIQALGVVIVLWIVFEAISIASNVIKRKRLESIEKRLGEIERKIDKVLSKK